MKKFSISRKKLSSEYAINDVIGQIYKQKDSLEYIALHHFHDFEIEQLLSPLHACLKLKEINLSENMTEDTQIPLINQLLIHLPYIKKINMSHSFLSERGIIALVNVCCSKKIQYDISYSRMSHERVHLYQKKFIVPKFTLRENKALEKKGSQFSLNQQLLVTNLPNYQQDFDYDCGATTILNILDYYNTVLKKNISSLTLKEIVNSIKTCTVSGAEIENMMAWFEAHNFEVCGGFTGTEELLRYYTSLGIPIIVNTNEWGGHYMIVTGFEAFDPVWSDKDKILCCDPLDYQQGNFNSEQNYTKRNLLQFLCQWRNSKGREGGYIVALPRELAAKYPEWKFCK